MSFLPNFRLATFEYDNNPLQTLDFPIKNERDITSSLSSGGFGKYIYTKNSRLYFMINSKSYLSCNLIITKKC